VKILMVTNNALEDKIGGLERYVRELSSALAGRGHDVTIIAKRWHADAPPRVVDADGVAIERHPVPSKRNPLYAPAYPFYVYRGVGSRTRPVAADDSDTVLHAHMLLPALPLAVRRQRFLLTFHAPVWRELLRERQDSYLLPERVQSLAVAALKRTEGFVASRATGAVVLSEFMRQELADLNPSAGARATVLPGGIDSSRFHVDDRVPRDVEPDAPVLFTARRFTPRTGVDELVRAMAVIVQAYPDAQLKLAGTGPMEAELVTLTQTLGLTKSVEFLGVVSDEELVAWYRRATLVVLPTRELEGFGLATAEALACGAVVVGTPAGATPELLSAIDPQLVASGTSAAAIAATVLDLLRAPERLRELRSKAAGRVLPEMGWDRIADRYLELYASLQRA
jgi:glycosyltransferase involved in cell wall biosynthesis